MAFNDKEEALEELVADVQEQLEDLFQSGFDTVHDSTLEELDSIKSLCMQYGMTHLSHLLGSLVDKIVARRHRTKAEADDLARVYADLQEYLYICREKITYDRTAGYYFNEALNDQARNYK